MSDPDDWRAWIAKATNDLLNIENNLQSAVVPWDTVCFHAQQAAEKALKALLVERGEVVPRTHDLTALLGNCAVVGFTVDELWDDCGQLQPYSVLVRYPGAPFEPDAAEGENAAEAARRVVDAVARILGKS